MARDWRWQKASFDGARFYVDASELPGGRRLVIHEYPGSERHDVEDLGRKAGKFEITAYFASETADADAAALRARLTRPGPGMLTIPMFGSMRVRAVESRPSWGQQRLNYVGFQITFVEEGNAFAPIPVGLGEATLAFMGAGLGATLGQAIGSNLLGVAQSDFVRADMRVAATVVADDIETLRAVTPLPEQIDSDVKLTIADTRDDLSEQSVDLPTAITTLVGVIDTIATEQTGGGAASTLQTMVDSALAARTAILAKWGVLPLAASIYTAASVAYAAQAARLLAIADYRDRASAQAARAAIAALAAKVTDAYADLGIDAQQAFDEIYGEAARHISSRIPNLAPVIVVETGVSLPSNVLAYRLYGDPNRGLELVERNGVATPCIMPLQFEAAAR